MTKLRPPLTSQRALTKIAGLIGWDAAAAIVGQAERTVRNWSDPDTSAGISMDAALKLDAAYVAAGGDSAPMLLWYQTRLEVETAEACADSIALASKSAIAAVEAGQAVAALIRASVPGAPEADRVIAQRETEEAIGAFTSALPALGVASDREPAGRRS